MSSNRIRLALARDLLKRIFGMWTPYQQHVQKLIFEHKLILSLSFEWNLLIHISHADLFFLLFWDFSNIRFDSVSDRLHYSCPKSEKNTLIYRKTCDSTIQLNGKIFAYGRILAININKKKQQYKQSSSVYVFEFFRCAEFRSNRNKIQIETHITHIHTHSSQKRHKF